MTAGFLLVSALVAVPAQAQSPGALTQAGPRACISENGSSGGEGLPGECIDGKALDSPLAVGVSPDGKSAYVASRFSDAVAAFQRFAANGKLKKLPGPARCVSETGSSGTCVDGKALDDPRSVAVSPDGESVYIASHGSDAVAAFARNTTTGELTQLAGTAGCISETGSGGACSDGNALDGPHSVAVSADGTSVYVASQISDAVAVFTRNTTTGELTQLAGTAGCVREGTGVGGCAPGTGLDGPRSVTLSPDGASVYVASSASDAVAAFARNTTTGELTQLGSTAGCTSETGSGGFCAQGKALDGPRSVAVSPDGTSAYVASLVSDAVTVFARNVTTGELTQLPDPAGCVSEDGFSGGEGLPGDCGDGRGLDGAFGVTASPDGKSVYVASAGSDGLVTFARHATTGELTQLSGIAGCMTDIGVFGVCADGRALEGAMSVAVSPDASSVYVASPISDAVVVFVRDTTTGQVMQLAAGCVSEDGSDGDCVDGKALQNPSSVAVSPDNESVYVASSFQESSVAAFARIAPTGHLVQLAGTAGCTSEDGSGGACADGKALETPRSMAVSPDGENLYVASGSGSGGAVAAFARNTTTGQLTQLAGTAGCVSETGSGGACADGKALGDPRSVAVSADGESVYVASASNSNAVAVFARNTTTGELTQLAGTAGCVSQTGSGGTCLDGKALNGPTSVTVSADDTSVYVTSTGFGSSGAVAAFARNTSTGELSQLPGTAGCTSEDGGSGEAPPPAMDCVDGKALITASSVAVSADGESVYVASAFSSNAVAVFSRNATTGELTQLAGTAGCISEDGTNGDCADGKALVGVNSVAVSADGTSVYAASNGFGGIGGPGIGAAAAFARNTTTGELTQLAGTAGCISETGSGGGCVAGKALGLPSSLAASPDGNSVYVASQGALIGSSGVAILKREP